MDKDEAFNYKNQICFQINPEMIRNTCNEHLRLILLILGFDPHWKPMVWGEEEIHMNNPKNITELKIYFMEESEQNPFIGVSNLVRHYKRRLFAIVSLLLIVGKPICT